MNKNYITAIDVPAGFIIPANKRYQPDLLAELFCALDSEQQAAFFNRISQIDEQYWEGRGMFQWRAMHNDLTDEARRVIVDMYEHTSEE